MTQFIDPREEEALVAIRQIREHAKKLARDLGLPDEAAYRLLTHAASPPKEKQD